MDTERQQNALPLYVVRSGLVLNRHEQFTPILDFAHAFPAAYALKLAQDKRATTTPANPGARGCP